MMSPRRSAVMGVVRALLLATVLCIVFYGYRLYQLGDVVFSYLPWNLFLAWLPLGIIILLVRLLRTRAWSSWPAIFVTILWLLFLPNSFYLVSDFIHLQEVSSSGVLYDAVMFTMFVFTGLLLGYSSLYVFHLELLKRMRVRTATAWIMLVLATCSFAIYIGRDLRWNSWDILLSPAGVLFDLSDRIIHPSTYGEMLGTVVIFFALLGGMYLVGWRLLRLARQWALEDN